MAIVRPLTLTAAGGQGETPVRYQPCGITSINDVSYQMLLADVTIAFIALSAARTVTLPLSTVLPDPTQVIRVIDGSGSCSAVNTITVQPYSGSGSDKIGGGNPSLASAYGWLELMLAAPGLWIFR